MKLFKRNFLQKFVLIMTAGICKYLVISVFVDLYTSNLNTNVVINVVVYLLRNSFYI